MFVKWLKSGLPMFYNFRMRLVPRPHVHVQGVLFIFMNGSLLVKSENQSLAKKFPTLQ